MCLQEVNSQYHREKDISCNSKLHPNALSSIAMDSEAIPSPLRGLSSAPETENCLGCTCGTKDNDQYSCSSKRLIEELVSIKIVTGL